MQLMPKSKHRRARPMPAAAQARPGPRADAPVYVDPVFIVFQERAGDRDSPLAYHVFPKGYSAGEYGLILTDLARHISRATGADVGEMLRLMMAEFVTPTTELTSEELSADSLAGKVFGVPEKKGQH